MLRNIKIAIGLGLMIKGALTVSKYLEDSLENKFKKPVDDKLKEEYLNNNIEEINQIMKNFNDLFCKTSTLSELGDDITDEFILDNIIFLDGELIDTPPIKVYSERHGERKAYFKIFSQTNNETKTIDFILRLHFNEWDGYLDIHLLNGAFYNVFGQKVLLVKNSNNKINTLPESNSILSYKFDFLYSDRDKNTVSFINVESQTKVGLRYFEC